MRKPSVQSMGARLCETLVFISLGASAVGCGTSSPTNVSQSPSGDNTGGSTGNVGTSGSVSAGTGAASGSSLSGTSGTVAGAGTTSGTVSGTGASGAVSGTTSGTTTGSGTSSGATSGVTTGSSGAASGTSSGASAGSGASSGEASGTSSGASAGSGASSGAASGTSSGASSGSASSGTATCKPVAPACTATGAAADPSVLQRGNDLERRGNYVEPLLTKQAAGTLAIQTSFKATFNGDMAASVLYLASGPAAAGCPTTGTAATTCKATTRAAKNGLFFAATKGNVIYALDETSGAIVWQTNLNPQGGSKDGIRGTPVVDEGTRSITIATGANDHHEVHSLSVDDGSERTGWPVILSPTTLSFNPGTGTVTFNSTAQNEHGALLLANNIVYVPFGGEYGDGGNYRGWIVAINVTDPTKVAGWVTQDQQSGIWGHGGLASDGTTIFAETGNGHRASINDANSDSEEVVRLTGMAQVTKNAANIFVSPNWQSMDATDKDFGASTPAFTPLPAGSNPSTVLVAPAKPGHVYFLNGSNLGTSLADVTVASTSAESVYTSPTIYTTESGVHAAIDVSVNPVCPAGSPAGQKMIISMVMQPGCSPFAQTTWCAAAANSGNGNQYNEPPISTTSDGGCADALVWFNNGANLTVVDGDSGQPLAAQPTGTCNNIEKMSWPIAVKNRIVVAADGQLCAWSINGN
jgi:hypothetical protein